MGPDALKDSESAAQKTLRFGLPWQARHSHATPRAQQQKKQAQLFEICQTKVEISYFEQFRNFIPRWNLMINLIG